MFRATLRLDDIPEDQLDPTTLDGAHNVLRFVLREYLNVGLAAVHLFYHEESDCVRICLWCPIAARSQWVEYVPLDGVPGKQLLARLRRRFTRRSAGGGHAQGALRCSLAREVWTLRVESPHVWDVRIYCGNERPDVLPYCLVFRGPKDDVGAADPSSSGQVRMDGRLEE